MSTTTTQKSHSVRLSNKERASIVHFMEAAGADVSAFTANRTPEMPKELRELLNAVLQAVKNEQSISISMLPKEVTTTTAAAMLDVSRPTVMKYIRNGRLSARKVGTHHRLKSEEVLALLEELKQQQRDAIFELMDYEDSLS